MNLQLRKDPFAVFDELFDQMLNRNGYLAARGADNAPAFARARLDVIDSGAAYEVKADLPGVRKEDISVDLHDNRVSISAVSRNEREQKEGERVLYSERSTTQYARSFELPTPVVEDGAEARYEDGVLTLRLPKRQEPQARRLAIQ